MKLVVTIPSYDREEWLAHTVEGVRDVMRPDDLIVYEQPKGKPDGIGTARRKIHEMAVAKHGEDALYLMMDDDAHLQEHPELVNIRWAMQHFEEMPLLGVCQCTISLDPLVDTFRRRRWVAHSYLIRGAVLTGGGSVATAYRDNENHADELLFSMEAWLHGWTVGTTGRCRIPRHVFLRSKKCFGEEPEVASDPKAVGGSEGSVADGAVSQSRVWDVLVDRGLAVVSGFHYRGQHRIPIMTRVQVTGKGLMWHNTFELRRKRNMGLAE